MNKWFIGFVGLLTIGLAANPSSPEITLREAVDMISPDSPAQLYCLGSGHQWFLHNVNGHIGHFDKRKKVFVGPTLRDSHAGERSICKLCLAVGHHLVPNPNKRSPREHRRLSVDSFKFTSDGLLKENVQLFVDCKGRN